MITIQGDRAFIDYKLSAAQEKISNKIVNAIAEQKDVLVHAVCGAGKTELVFGAIERALKKRQRVGFTIPRRDVVIELSERLQNTFKESTVVSLYGGHHEILTGDIVVLTTHQLYRYEHYFDLLIIDEIDAFPYRDNVTLEAFFKRALKGNYIVLSATPSPRLILEFQTEGKVKLDLLVRYHGYPIPLPKIKIVLGYFKIIYLYRLVKNYIAQAKPVLIFVPTIRHGIRVYTLLSLFLKGGQNVSSQSKNRAEIIQDFRHKKYKFLVTTSILERGVTLENLQVVIYDSDHPLYDDSSLIQISGRVGRKIDFPRGEVIFLANKKTPSQTFAIQAIESANKHL